MEEAIESLRPVSRSIDRIQSILALDFLDDRLEDVNGAQQSLGRVGIIGCLLGIVWGIHVACGCLLLWVLASGVDFFLDPGKVAMAWTWCFYVTAMCTFHLLEFFVTAFFNPREVSSDSFLVNHSKAYTVAALVCGSEFWLRFWFFGSTTTAAHGAWWTTTTAIGVVVVVVSQVVRSRAMVKCGESFNHYIQTSRKDNHVLVTDGIYTWFRHPSYTGFYYWSIGTQLVLRNSFSGLLFAVAGWKFFSQRIPYEERSLVRMFGDRYHDYAMRSYVGIPFIPSIPKDDVAETTEVQNDGHDKND